MFLTFSEYQDMGGGLSESEYKPLEYKAERLIIDHTFGRIAADDEVDEVVKNLVFELIDKAVSDSGNISSQSNDGVSISYRTDFTASDTYSDLIRTYLSELKDSEGTPLLYCGVD